MHTVVYINCHITSLSPSYHNRSLHSTITTLLYIFHYFDISHACPIKVNNYFDISHACPTNYFEISHACPIKVNVKVNISIYDTFTSSMFEINCNFVIARLNKVIERMKKYIKYFRKKQRRK